MRAQVAPEVQPIYAGYYIWRGAPNEAELGPEALRIFPYYAFYLPERQQVLGYPIAGFDNALEPGRRRYNFIWYRVGDAATLREMCIDEHGRQHEHSVPAPLVRKDLVARMRADAAQILPPALLDALDKIAQPFFTPVYDFNSPTLVYGRVALVGDAAGASRPHMGFGVSKAGGDAQALAQALSSTTTSTPRSRATTRLASRSASASCATAGCWARTSAWSCAPRRTGACGSCCRTRAR